jgi:hypothetical protein
MSRLVQHTLNDRFCAIPGAKPHPRGLQTLRVASLLAGLLGVLGWSASGAAAILTVNVLTDTGGESCPATCSLRAALATASDGDEIQFSVTGTILLSQGALVVDRDVTITGPGASQLALDGNSTSQVLQVNSGVTATVSGLTLQNGLALEGGGIANDGDLTLTHCTLSGNSADCVDSSRCKEFIRGGGILNTGTATVTSSTLSGNNGSGIANFGDLMLTNCTLRDNNGGGIFNFGTATVTSSTLSGNNGGGISNGVIDFITATLNLASSIIANSKPPSEGNCTGVPITSHGDNISSDATCVATHAALHDRNMTDPLLNPAGLQDNGGQTLTIALQPSSPARDAVRHNACPPPATDQRGFLRPAHGENGTGARCDIGALEFNALPPVVDSLVTFVPLPSTYQTTSETTGCPGGLGGHFASQPG